MPIYEFICVKCGHQFEKLVAGMSGKSSPKCPQCAGPTRRQVSLFAAHCGAQQTLCGQFADSCQVGRDGNCPGSACPRAKQ